MLSIFRWPQITEAAKLTLASSVDTLIQNMALLVLEELGRALAAALEARTLELSALKEHWINILSNALVPILQNEHSPIMPGACDILSTIGSPIFLCISYFIKLIGTRRFKDHTCRRSFIQFSWKGS